MQHTTQATVGTDALKRITISPDRRREPRFATENAVTVHAFGNGSVEVLPGHVRDVSRSGLRVRIASQLAAGTNIQVVMGENVIALGEVRYFVPQNGFFDHGIAIQKLADGRHNLAHAGTPQPFLSGELEVTLPQAKPDKPV